MSESLPVLAGVLRTAPESDALAILGRLLDSLPIPVLLTDCSTELRCAYGNAAWRAWVPPEKFPIEGSSLLEIMETLADSPLLAVLRNVCASGVAAHLRDFEYVGLVGAPVTLPGNVTVWDWEVYRLTAADGTHGNLLVVGMDATDRALQDPGVSPEARKRAVEMRERASGILRIFGVAPGTDNTTAAARLSKREQEVADLVARGLGNAEIARQLFVSPATVATHIAHILQKLDFSSRVEIAAWVVERRLRQEAESPG